MKIHILYKTIQGKMLHMITFGISIFKERLKLCIQTRCSFLSQNLRLKASYQMSNIQLYVIKVIKNPYSCESSFRSLNTYGGSDSILLLAKSLQKQPQVGYSKFLSGSVILPDSIAIWRHKFYSICQYYLLHRLPETWTIKECC